MADEKLALFVGGEAKGGHAAATLESLGEVAQSVEHTAENRGV
jgi:hypothetical protein